MGWLARLLLAMLGSMNNDHTNHKFNFHIIKLNPDVLTVFMMTIKMLEGREVYRNLHASQQRIPIPVSHTLKAWGLCIAITTCSFHMHNVHIPSVII